MTDKLVELRDDSGRTVMHFSAELGQSLTFFLSL